MKLLQVIGLSAVALTTAAPESRSVLKIVTRESFGPGEADIVEYVDAEHRRTETRRPPQELIRITRCDRREEIVLDTANRTYRSVPIFVPNAVVRTVAAIAARNKSKAPPPAPTLLVETTTVRTGDRRSAFGYEARRVIVTRRDIPLTGDRVPTVTESDGWYIDVEARPSCERGYSHTLLIASVASADGRAVTPVVTFKDIGDPERGFPIELKTISHGEGRAPQSSVVSHRIVTQLSRVRADDALFDIPPGFRPDQSRIQILGEWVARNLALLKALLFS